MWIILDYGQNLVKEERFLEGKIGSLAKKSKKNDIRIGAINWIDSWIEDSSLNNLNLILSKIMLSTKNYFRISLKSFEPQFAFYDKGGFYKSHLDQHKQARQR